ncbi:MAG: CAP domain-containing protein [Oscillochloridaceae bacterium umkhey_bin13]
MRTTIHTSIAITLLVMLSIALLGNTTSVYADPEVTAVSPRMYLPLVLAPGNPGQPADETAIREEIVALVNSERAKNGCGPVILNPLLTNAAQAHAEDMAVNRFFAHINLQGQTPGQRITATGYRWMRVGENIAAGQTTAQQVMLDPQYGWMFSAVHRANILNCEFTELGVGHIELPGSPFTHYWVQKFARPML